MPSKLSSKLTFVSSAWGFEEVVAEIGFEESVSEGPSLSSCMLIDDDGRLGSTWNLCKASQRLSFFNLELLHCHQYLVYVVGGFRHDEA